MDLGEGVSGPKAKKSPKSLQKVRKKSRKRSKKSPETHFQTFWRLCGPFSRLFWDFWGPGAGRPRETFSGLFGDFLALGPETPSPRSTEPQGKRFNRSLARTGVWRGFSNRPRTLKTAERRKLKKDTLFSVPNSCMQQTLVQQGSDLPIYWKFREGDGFRKGCRSNRSFLSQEFVQ